jgi:hypothetical protein
VNGDSAFRVLTDITAAYTGQESLAWAVLKCLEDTEEILLTRFPSVFDSPNCDLT